MSTYTDASLILYPSGYKEDKLYSLKPTDGSGDLTFTRASTATRVNESGLIEEVTTGVPRIDYTGGGCGKLLLEPQRTNSIGYSEDFSDAYWTKIELTVSANAATSPDGTTNSDKLIPSTANGRHSIVKTSQAISGGYYTVYAKADGYDWILLTSHSTSAPSARGAFFNVANGTIGTEGSGIVASVTDMGNGWYKCSINDGASPSSLYTVIVTNADNTESFEGNGTDGVLIWGAQNEQGSFPTSYIHTTSGVAVTRVADSASKSGISSLINSAEGVLYAEISALADDLTNRAISLSDGTLNNGIQIFYYNVSNRMRCRVYSGGVLQNTINIIGYTITDTHKIALKWESGFMSVFVDGVINGTALAITSTPVGLDRLNLDLGQGSSDFYGNVQNLMVFPSALSDTELATLTTL